jgi:ribonuclease-3
MTEGPGGDTGGADRGATLDALEAALDYRFVDRGTLEAALRHSSYAHERALDSRATCTDRENTADSNERLEFLGDAVLALVVAEALFVAKPEWREGELTRALHSIVEGGSLTELARSLDLGSALRLGRTEESSGGHEKPSILEDGMEAVIGAMYLDGGLGVVQRFLGRVFAEALAADAVRVERDPKTELQESLMATVGEFPSYRLVRDSEVEGDDERFTIEVASQGTVLAQGTGRTKRAAQKGAARAALEHRREAEAKEA